MAISLIIGATDRTSYLHYDSHPNYQLERGQRGQAMVPLSILAGDSYMPTFGQQVFLKEDTTCIFAGTIDDVQTRWNTPDGGRMLTLSCVGLEQQFDTLLVSPPRSYVNKTAAYIVNDLLTNVCAGVPVTAGTISTGVTIPLAVYQGDRVSDIFTALAQACGFIWYVRYSDQTLQFHLENAEAAPFVMSTVLWEEMNFTQDRRDFRDRQIVRISFLAFAPSNQVFAGNVVSTTWTLPYPAATIEAVLVTDAVQASATGTFTGVPSPGDTVTVGDAEYTWVSALDNTALAQIKIGADAAGCASNLADAINANPANAGITFSLPTWENSACNVTLVAGATVTVKEKFGGSAGNSVAISELTANFTWSGANLSGGTDGTVRTSKSFGVAGVDTDVFLTYTPGTATLETADFVAPPYTLSVQYRRLGGDCIAVEDTALVVARAAAEGGTGKYQQLQDLSGVTDALVGLLAAQTGLSQYKALPQSFTFMTNRGPGLIPGLWQTITLTSPAPSNLIALVNGTWLIQEVYGVLIPGGDIAPGMGYFTHTVKVTNARIASYVNFWEQLALAGGNSTVAAAAGTGTGGGTSAETPGTLGFTPLLAEYGMISVDNVEIGTPQSQTGIDWYLLFVDELLADVFVTTDDDVDDTTNPIVIDVTDNPDRTTPTATLDFAEGQYVLWNTNGAYEIGQITEITGSAPNWTFTIDRLSQDSPAVGWFGSAMAEHDAGTQLFVAQLRRVLPNSQAQGYNEADPPTRFDFDLPAACVLAIMGAPYVAGASGATYGSFVIENCATADLPGIRTLTGAVISRELAGNLSAGAGVNVFEDFLIPFDLPYGVGYIYVKTGPGTQAINVNLRISYDDGATWATVEGMSIAVGDKFNWSTDPPEDRQAPYSGSWPFRVWLGGSRLNASIEQVGSGPTGADMVLMVRV